MGLPQRWLSGLLYVWPVSGEVQVFNNVEMDQFLHLREGDPVPIPLEYKPFDLSPGD